MIEYLKNFIEDIGNCIATIFSKKYRRQLEIEKELKDQEEKKRQQQEQRLSVMLRYADLVKSLNYMRNRDKSKIVIKIGNMIYSDSFELELDKKVVEMIIVKEMNVIENLIFQERTKMNIGRNEDEI